MIDKTEAELREAEANISMSIMTKNVHRYAIRREGKRERERERERGDVIKGFCEKISNLAFCENIINLASSNIH